MRFVIVAATIGRDGPERLPGDREQMLRELAGRRAFDRPVPGVVHPRCHLVGNEFALDLEELECEHPDVVQ